MGQKQQRKRDKQIASLKSNQVRLMISVPALMFLSTLLVCLVIRVKLQDVASGLPMGEVRRESEELADIVLWAGLVGSAVMGLAGIGLAWSIVRPVRRLMRAMQDIAAGDLSPKAAEDELGELGQLGSSFNQMVDHLHNLFAQRDRQMRESAAGTIITLDQSTRVIAADASVTRILGIDPEKLLGHELLARLTTFCGEENDPFLIALDAGLQEALAGRTGISPAEYIHPRTLSRCLYSMHFSILESTGRTSPSLLLDIRDLTGMRQFHEQMQRADRLAALGTLATGIAHEIRNPLASMKAMTQLLAEDLASSQKGMANEYLPRVVSEIDRLDRLVRSIMDFANTERGPVEEINLNAMAREALEVAQHRTDSDMMKKIHVRWELKDNLPELPLERQRIHQALLNLVLNALEALAERGGGVLEFTTIYDSTHQRPIVFKIANTADEIPDAVKRQMFEPFFTTKPSGSGLGLPIAYQIIIANCGVMDSDYCDGKLEFIIRFPLDGCRARIGRASSSMQPKLSV